MRDRVIAFYGYGRFGAAFGERLLEVGLEVRAHDPERPPPSALAAATVEELTGGAQLIVLAVPVAGMANAVAQLRPQLTAQQVVIDVGSVKTGPVDAMNAALGSELPWVGTHPLFGPTSLARGDRPLRAVICPNPLHPEATERARQLYRAVGCELLEETPESHDRFMAEGHALAYFVAKGFIDAEIELDTPFAPPSVRAISQTVEAVRADAAHLFASLHRENPYASEARRQLLDALRATDEALLTPASSDEVAHAEPGQLHIDEAPASPGGPLEARALIDELDRELVELLARRAELAGRAARVTGSNGGDQELLEDRRRTAIELDLDPQTVADVFQSVLRLTRSRRDRK